MCVFSFDLCTLKKAAESHATSRNERKQDPDVSAGKTEEELWEEVKQIWAKVQQTVDPDGDPQRSNLVVKRTGWKTVRIFVSSTFNDFHAEREVLIKEVRENNPQIRVGLNDIPYHLLEWTLPSRVAPGSDIVLIVTNQHKRIWPAHGGGGGESPPARRLEISIPVSGYRGIGLPMYTWQIFLGGKNIGKNSFPNINLPEYYPNNAQITRLDL